MYYNQRKPATAHSEVLFSVTKIDALAAAVVLLIALLALHHAGVL